VGSYFCKVSGYVLCGVLIISWLAHALRVYARRLTIHE
jgi:hypothetical protein